MSQAGDEQYFALHEIVAAARANLDVGPWGYLAGGAETELTVSRNRAALDSIAFRPRVLRDVSTVDTSAVVLGERSRLPVFVAPVGQLNHFDDGAAATVAKAAANFGVPQMLSSASPPDLEEVSAAGEQHRRFYQLYVTGDAAWVSERIKRVVDDGWHAFCLTVDVAKYSRRERDIVNRWGIRWQAGGFEHMSPLAALNWGDVERIRAECPIPLMLKGIATVADALAAVELGVDVIYVSNHGGRQLDHGLGAAAVLPEIVDAVDGNASVFVDGGFYRGSDVVKAIALGADAVGLGRLPCYGLAADGQHGVERTLELVEDEMERTMGLLGVTSLAELDRGYLAPAPPAVGADVLSAFPHLGGV